MMALGPIAFTAPALLWALLALPVLWWLLRAVPPAPVLRRFPGVALLLGLADRESVTDRTPWWLLLLRALAVAALILAFAGPVLNPATRTAQEGPLLIAVDAGWPGARDWPRRQERMAELLEEAGRAGRAVAVVALTEPGAGAPVFRPAADWADRIVGIVPRPWLPDPEALMAWAETLGETAFETYWISDGPEWEGRADLLAALQARGPVTVYDSATPVFALRPPVFSGQDLSLGVVRMGQSTEAEITVSARGPDPGGVERELARATARLAEGETETEVVFDLPAEVRNRLTRFEILGQRTAGATALADDALRRRQVALVASREGFEGLDLLSQLFYLRQALAPSADLIEGGLDSVLRARPDVIVLADVARVTEIERDELLDWIEAGGLLLRFAGPRLAASDLGRSVEDPLLPVRLRAGGRSVGGAMSWGEPRALREFAEESPFAGLRVPADVTVSAQVLAQPDPELAGRTIAALADGTPLVTRRAHGAGQIVLFHVTANAEWSTLPLSGLFLQMLERLAIATRPAGPDAAEVAGTNWRPEMVIDGFGTAQSADRLAAVPGARLAPALAGLATAPDMPPGLYAGLSRRVALNVAGPETLLAPAVWPADVPVEGPGMAAEMALKGWLLGIAMLVLLADVIATLLLSGRLSGGALQRRAAGLAGAAVVAALALGASAPAALAQEAEAQAAAEAAAQLPPDDRLALIATRDVVLAHVLTGDTRLDQTVEAGLRGLSAGLFARTSVEPAAPVGIDIERDEIAIFPFIYWPITDATPRPSDAAYVRLNTFLRTGGMILFDTRDADITGLGIGSPASRRLQEIAAGLDIPPLEPVPADHVLTRTFYLIQDFPGRHTGPVWLEAAPPDAVQVEGMPFRNLNDGVTPVVIGGNDWASAWAINAQGRPMMSIGRGSGGERQREMALRFGINLIMYVLTGNYKSDQVHIPALLERLGQ